MKWAVLKDFGQPLGMHCDFPNMIQTDRNQNENWYFLWSLMFLCTLKVCVFHQGG